MFWVQSPVVRHTSTYGVFPSERTECILITLAVDFLNSSPLHSTTTSLANKCPTKLLCLLSTEVVKFTMLLSVDQIRNIGIAGRSASVLSVLGIATIIVTFCLSPQFRNPIHRIIFINALFNVFDVIATTISISGPAAGNHSALCQFQGFLMQTYVQS